jgi:hypothetical protein
MMMLSPFSSRRSDAVTRPAGLKRKRVTTPSRLVRDVGTSDAPS